MSKLNLLMTESEIEFIEFMELYPFFDDDSEDWIWWVDYFWDGSGI